MLIRGMKERGDTLIEVLFAISIFSLVAVGSLTIMNQGSNISQRALEINLVRNEMDAQSETLRFLNSSYITAFNQGGSYTGPALEWTKIKSKAITNQASDLGTCTPPSDRSFILNTHSATFADPSTVNATLGAAKTFSQLVYNSDGSISADGIWVEAVSSVNGGEQYQSNAGYIDFNIRACWSSPGQSAPVTLGTIVRLYEPR